MFSQNHDVNTTQQNCVCNLDFLACDHAFEWVVGILPVTYFLEWIETNLHTSFTLACHVQLSESFLQTCAYEKNRKTAEEKKKQV